MKQILRKTFLVLAAGIMSSAAWADGEIAFTAGNTIGATNNSTAWYGAASEIFEIGPTQTLTLKFKSYTATDAELTSAKETRPWGSYMTHIMNFWDGNDQNLFMRGDGYGWKNYAEGKADSGNPSNFNTNDTPSASTFTYNATNFGTYRDMIGTGADVVMTIARYGQELRITQDITTSTNAKYTHYFVGKFGTSETASIWCQMTVERAHVVVSADKAFSASIADPTIVGQKVGLDNNTSAFWTAWTDYYTIAPNKEMKLKFKNYSNKVQNWNNWTAYITTDADRAAGGYTEYFGLRADFWNPLQDNGSNPKGGNTGITSNFDWNTFKDEMDGATVLMTVTRSDANVKVRFDITPVSGTARWEEFTQACGDGTQNIRVFLTVDGAHLDVLSSSEAAYVTIGSKGWTTFSNADYALNFASVDGLTAYQITGQTGKVITKSEVTSTVPKNTGLLLNGTAGTTYTIPVAASGTALSGNKLVAGTGSAISMASGHTYYVLTYEDGDAQFKKLTSAVAVPVGKAYLDFPTTIEARSIDIEGDGTTGIQNLKVGKEDNVYYDLQGRRVLYPKKGLYIVNGKKVILK